MSASQVIFANLYQPAPSAPIAFSEYNRIAPDGFNVLISFLVATLFKLPFR
uniref:Uncharacterized protein n=1 Tax=Siphoviridae sp. ctnFo11 TaxID=2826454 RepID=A0A8S5N4P4_9CAUD|nr:MAG TPA: hypothetical protein [Siphoviridae sp. ctnFo11]